MVGSSVMGNGVGVIVGGEVELGMSVGVTSTVWLVGKTAAASVVGVDVGDGERGRSVAPGAGGAGMTQAWRLPMSRNTIP